MTTTETKVLTFSPWQYCLRMNEYLLRKVGKICFFKRENLFSRSEVKQENSELTL